jgi:hypothetical protein
VYTLSRLCTLFSLWCVSCAWHRFIHTFKTELLYRDGELLTLDRYINVGTTRQEILALAFSPDLNTATLLAVTMDLTGTQPDCEYSVEHFTGFIGEGLALVLVINSAMATLSIVLLLLLYPKCRQAIKGRKAAHNLSTDVDFYLFEAQLSGHILFEGLLCLTLATVAIIQALRALESDRRLTEVYGSALAVPWTSPNISYEAKVEQYLIAVDSVRSLLDEEYFFESVTFGLMLVCIVRLVAYMTVQ